MYVSMYVRVYACMHAYQDRMHLQVQFLPMQLLLQLLFYGRQRCFVCLACLVSLLLFAPYLCLQLVSL
jgi:hypothetical protein